MLDVAIIGAGPAAITASIYASRAGLSVEIFERNVFGGVLPEIAHIGNFPGFDGTGADLAHKLVSQAKSFGVKFTYGTCTSITKTDDSFTLIIDEEPKTAKTVIVATGSEAKSLGFDLDVPVSYCAVCDGSLYKGKNIAVVGGGNSAVGEAIYLADIVNNLTLFSHSPLRAEKSLISSLSARGNVTIRENIEITRELLSDFDAVFAFIGKCPATSFLPTSVLDSDGYVVADSSNMTSIPGLFVAGDVKSGAVRQAVTAAADGAISALSAVKYLNN